MSTPAQEQAFCQAVANAESTRQSAKGSAAATYNFVKANYAAYVTALVAADVAYCNAVITAATANGVSPDVAIADGPIASSWSSKIGGY
jgi:hypothetical protein